MLDANNYTFLIEFEASSNGSYIVNTCTLSNNGLTDLAHSITERKKTNTHPFKVFVFDRHKRKFSKITMQKFIACTDFCTELNQVLTDIYK